LAVGFTSFCFIVEYSLLMQTLKKQNRLIHMILLILAGEIIFGLPFHLARFFRPTFLDVFNISNTNLGDIYAFYGITAMFSYFFGGMLADKFSARTLMSSSLFLTSFGGFYMTSIPDISTMFLIYGYWGITTIFLFWSAMIKATKEWGGDYSQGKAFGILDGGRGLLATIVSMAAILIYTAFLPIEINAASETERLHGFQAIIWLYSILTALIGILVWFLLPESQKNVDTQKQANTFHNLKGVLKNRLVWLNAGIIVCAYSTYKGLDNTTLYAHEILGMNEVNAAKLFAYGSLTRPFAAILAGVIADRWVSSRVILFLFTALVFLFGMLALFDGLVSFPTIIIINIFVTFFLVFAIRGIYFALIQETRTQHHITGTAVGIVSFIGFTPEIFFGSISGRILDANPGVTGHQNYFLFLTIIALVGIGITATLRKLTNKYENTNN